MFTQTKAWTLQIWTILTLSQVTIAFVPQVTYTKTPCDNGRYQPITATYDPYEGSFKGRDGMERNKARMDLRNFLTQRSIQSFVYLLNQCREEHTVRWLEKKLDFKKIDSFHGTGAFNVTLFPEWDSLFLELANQDAEKVIIEVQQKRTHRGWAHQASYINNINSGSSSSCSSNAESSSVHRSRGIAGNYLANLGRDTSASTMPTDSLQGKQPAKKPIPRAAGIAGSYLDALNRKVQPQAEQPKQKKKTGRKTRKERELIRMEKQKKLDNVDAPIPAKSTPGIQAGYLETLYSNTIDSTPIETDKRQGRKVNPFLEEKTFEYQFDIDPPSLVTRIISIREQISKEWKQDLDTLVRTNDRILDDYEENQRKEASSDDESDDDDDEKRMLRRLVAPYGPSQEGKTLRYDRDAMTYLTNSIASQDHASSPFRKSNFDLLLLLCTQESIHRVLQEYKEDVDDAMHMDKYEWLHSFYKMNVKEFFDGHEHAFGRADKFLEKLLMQSPVARETRKGGLYLIDPVTITEDVLRERSMVAREWKSIVATIPDEHLDLRRILFTRHLLEVTDWKITGIGSNTLHVYDSLSVENANEQGVFE